MLTVTEIRSAKPQEKPRKLSDGGGLYLLVNPNLVRKELRPDEPLDGGSSGANIQI